MTIPCSTKDLENKKFVECPENSGKVAVRVQLCDDTGIEIDVGVSPELPPNFESIDTYGTLVDAAIGGYNTVVTYTVPTSKLLILDKIEMSGDNVSKFRVKIEGVIHGVRRLNYTDHNADIHFKSYELTAGQTVLLEVENCGEQIGDFDGKIIGSLKTL